MDEMEKDELKKDELKTSEAPENASHEKHSDDDHDSAAAQHPDYCQELATIVRGTITPKALKEKVENYHENDIADVLSILNRAEREKLYHVLDAQTLSTVLEYAEDVEVYLNELGLRQRIQVLSHMETDKVVEYLKTLDKTERNNLMDLFDEDTRHDVNLLWSFDEDEIGSVMTTNYIEVTEGISVREAMKELIDQAAENDNISTIYVTSESGEYRGAIELKKLIIAREDTALASITSQNYPYVYASEEIDGCISSLEDVTAQLLFEHQSGIICFHKRVHAHSLTFLKSEVKLVRKGDIHHDLPAQNLQSQALITSHQIVFLRLLVFFVLKVKPQTENTICRIFVFFVGDIQMLVGDFLTVSVHEINAVGRLLHHIADRFRLHEIQRCDQIRNLGRQADQRNLRRRRLLETAVGLDLNQRNQHFLR